MPVEKCVNDQTLTTKAFTDLTISPGYMESLDLRVPADICPTCGESYVASKVMSLIELMAAYFMSGQRRIDGPDFCFIRKSMGLTKEMFAKEFGIEVEQVIDLEKADYYNQIPGLDQLDSLRKRVNEKLFQNLLSLACEISSQKKE